MVMECAPFCERTHIHCSSSSSKGGHVHPDNRERAHILAQPHARPERLREQEKSLPVRQAFSKMAAPDGFEPPNA